MMSTYFSRAVMQITRLKGSAPLAVDLHHFTVISVGRRIKKRRLMFRLVKIKRS